MYNAICNFSLFDIAIPSKGDDLSIGLVILTGWWDTFCILDIL
jgi:hypothetical protein